MVHKKDKSITNPDDLLLTDLRQLTLSSASCSQQQQPKMIKIPLFSIKQRRMTIGAFDRPKRDIFSAQLSNFRDRHSSTFTHRRRYSHPYSTGVGQLRKSTRLLSQSSRNQCDYLRALANARKLTDFDDLDSLNDVIQLFPSSMIQTRSSNNSTVSSCGQQASAPTNYSIDEDELAAYFDRFVNVRLKMSALAKSMYA